MNLVVGMGDMKVSGDPQATIVTFALGSCIGITVFDPLVKAGGLLHFMLPESSTNPEKALKNPFMFADTGIPRLFQEIYKIGGDKRNYAALRKILWTGNMLIHAEEVGGQVNRTVRLDLSTGKVSVKTSGDGEKEI
jgi:chemotaxis protein CheD